jgi:hypothetical protein
MVNNIVVYSLLLPSNEDQILNKGHMVTSRRKIVLLITSTNFSVDVKVVGAWSTVPTSPNFGNTGTVPDVKIVTIYSKLLSYIEWNLLRKPAAVKLNIMMKDCPVNSAQVIYYLNTSCYIIELIIFAQYLQ